MRSGGTGGTGDEAGLAGPARTRLKPIGFWSYSRQDDELSFGKLSGLRTLLMAEIQQQYGRDRVQLFQDASAISHGAEWEREIRSSLGNSTFFIPIITPNFVQSEWCSAEVSIFLQREQELFGTYPDLPRRSRIFPLHLIDIGGADPHDPVVLAALEARQWFDFRPFRFRSLKDETVHEAIAAFAASIRDLLQIKVTPPLTAADRDRMAAAAAASAAAAEAARREAEAAETARREEQARVQREDAAAAAALAEQRAAAREQREEGLLPLVRRPAVRAAAAAILLALLLAWFLLVPDARDREAASSETAAAAGPTLPSVQPPAPAAANGSTGPAEPAAAPAANAPAPAGTGSVPSTEPEPQRPPQQTVRPNQPEQKEREPTPVRPRGMTVYFGDDSATLTPQARSRLDAFATAYLAGPGGEVVISGHTDRSRSAAYSVGMSQRMADIVRDYLAFRGVPGGAITTQSFGSSRPAVQTADGVREPRNRRVVLSVR